MLVVCAVRGNADERHARQAASPAAGVVGGQLEQQLVVRVTTGRPAAGPELLEVGGDQVACVPGCVRGRDLPRVSGRVVFRPSGGGGRGAGSRSTPTPRLHLKPALRHVPMPCIGWSVVLAETPSSCSSPSRSASPAHSRPTPLYSASRRRVSSACSSQKSSMPPCRISSRMWARAATLSGCAICRSICRSMAAGVGGAANGVNKRAAAIAPDDGTQPGNGEMLISAATAPSTASYHPMIMGLSSGPSPLLGVLWLACRRGVRPLPRHGGTWPARIHACCSERLHPAVPQTSLVTQHHLGFSLQRALGGSSNQTLRPQPPHAPWGGAGLAAPPWLAHSWFAAVPTS